MHITFYKSGKIPIPPKLYGGCERIIYWLGKAFIELGHRVTLIANPQSEIPGAELRVISGDDNSGAWLKLIPDSTDIVQLFNGFLPELKKPFLVRIGGNGKPGERFHPNTIFVSQKHAANHGSKNFVHNGLDPNEYLFSEKRDDYAIFLAKARWPVKNFHGAVKVSRRAGIELKVLGSRNWPFDLQKLFPPIRGVRCLGMIGGEEKKRLLSRARCLIFPVRWHEPFGSATIESLVSGAFVAATPYGSLPEIVTPETGMLSASSEELAEAVKNPQRFNPKKCRERVLKHFTHLEMAKKFLKYYEIILTRGTLLEKDETTPATPSNFIANQLLPWMD